MKGNRRPDLFKGLAAGLTAGFVASWTMNEFQAAWSKAAEGFEKPHRAQAMQPDGRLVETVVKRGYRIRV